MIEDTIRGMKDALMEVRKSKECLVRILNVCPNELPLVMRGWIIHLYAETEEVEEGIVRDIKAWQKYTEDMEGGAKE